MIQRSKKETLDLLDGVFIESMMLGETVLIKNGKIILLESKKTIDEPTDALIEGLKDELFINEFNCYPTEENIRKMIFERTLSDPDKTFDA